MLRRKKMESSTLPKPLMILVKLAYGIMLAFFIGTLAIQLTGCSKKESPSREEEIKNKFSMNEAEKAYWNTVQPKVEEMEEMGQGIVDVMYTQQKESNWKEATKKMAEQIIADYEYITSLEFPEDARVFRNMVSLFSYAIMHANENYIKSLSSADKSYQRFWLEDFSKAKNYLKEVKFYTVYGVTINEQLNRDLKEAMPEDIIDFAGLSASGTPNLWISFRTDNVDDKEELENKCLQKVKSVLETLSKREEYQYLNVTVTAEYFYTNSQKEKKDLQIVYTTFRSSKRKALDFETLSWAELPSIADKYFYYYD